MKLSIQKTKIMASGPTTSWQIEVVLKLSIQKTKIMASGPTTSWQIEGETVGWLTLFLGDPKSLQKVISVKLREAYYLERKL